MKKTTLILIITSVILVQTACGPNGKEQQQKTANQVSPLTPPPPNSFTLNGIPTAAADVMVKTFIGAKGKYDATDPTCIWFPKEALKQMLNILSQTTTSDGIRFYFAKTIPDSRYTVVAVSTTDGGIDPADPTQVRHKHMDYFQSTDPTPPGISIIGTLGDVGYTVGALLYSPNAPTATDNCPNPSPHYITHKTAYAMVNQYSGDEINATSEWFDKCILQDLLNATQDGGGVRIYYARHLQIAIGDTVTRHGFLLEPTYAKIVGQKTLQYDDFICFQIHICNKQLKPRDDGGGVDNGEECPTNCQDGSGITWQ